MKILALAVLLGCGALQAQPKVTLRHVQVTSGCGEQGCVSTIEERRELMITAPANGVAAAYQVDVFVPDHRGGRRTRTFLVLRHEVRIGAFTDRQSATFFVLPIDLDIPILDVWVSALAATQEPAHWEGDAR